MLSVTDERTGQTLRAADHRRHDPGRGAAPDQGRRGRLRADVLRPGVPRTPPPAAARSPGSTATRASCGTAASRSSSSASTAPISRSPTCWSSASCRPQDQLDGVDPRHHASTPTSTRTSRSSSRASATTRTRWGCCSPRSARCRPSIPRPSTSRTRRSATSRRSGMIAKMPTLAAFAYRHNLGLPYVYPDNDLDYPGNFLSMMFKMTELKYEPDPRLARALDVLWILHADHEQNCSTNAVRGVGSSQVDPYSAVAAGVAALYGPLHGGANEAVLRMLDRIGTVENIPDFLEGVKQRQRAADGLRPPRLQELRPARADHQEARRRGVRGHRPQPEARHRGRAGEARARRRLLHEPQALPERRLLLGPDLPGAAASRPTMFTVMFAIPRTSGWMSQWLEMVDDSEQKIARPRQIYTGGGPARLRADETSA